MESEKEILEKIKEEKEQKRKESRYRANKKYADTHTKKVTVSMQNADYAEFEKICKKKNTPIATMIKKLIKEFVKKHSDWFNIWSKSYAKYKQ